MSAAQDLQNTAAAPARGPRKLAIARHAHGVDAIGWVLLGFVLGAAAAIAVLLNADFPRRTGAAPQVISSQGPVIRLQLDQAPRQAAVMPPLAPLPVPARPPPAPQGAAAPAVLGSAVKPGPGAAPAAGGLHPRKGAAVAEGMAEDAAAAGMTSRAEGGDSGLY